MKFIGCTNRMAGMNTARAIGSRFNARGQSSSWTIWWLLLGLLQPIALFGQGVLTNGVTYQGTITPGGDSDLWTFPASAGDRIVIRVGEITQAGAFTPRLRLQNPSAVQIASAQNAVSAEIVVAATNTGTFTLIVDDAGGVVTGTYRLTLAKSPGEIVVAPGDEGGPLTNGMIYEGNNLPPGDLDVWSFSAMTGDSFVIKAGQMSDTNNFDPWVRVYGPDGVLLGSAADVASAEVALRATNSGTFLVVVATDYYYSTAASGTYRLTLAKTGDAIVVAPGDEGGLITNGVAHQGNLPLGDLDVWSFAANAGDSLVLKIGQITDVGNFDPWIRLYGPNGALLSSVADVAAAEVALRATNSGTFLVVIGNHPYYSDAASGTYRLKLAKTGSPFEVSPGDEGGPLTNGVAHQGNLPLGDLDVWSFAANAGDSLVLKIGQITDVGNFDPWIRLYGPNGALLSSVADVAAAEVALRATNSGTFLVVIGNNPYYSDAASGTYRLKLAKTGSPLEVSPGDEGGPLTNGVAHQGNLPLGDLDIWSLTATAGQSITLRVGQATETLNFAPWVRLYGPDGALLGSNWAAAVGEVTLRATNSGTFQVVIANYPYYSDAASGSYVLTLAKTGSANITAAGDEGGALTGQIVYTGAIPIGDLDLWMFTVCAGDFIEVRADQLSETNSFAPWVRLYSPGGVLIGSGWGATAGGVTLRATNSGTFLVVVGNNDYYNNAGNGTYQLTVNGLSDGLKLCIPIITGMGTRLGGVGGISNATFVLLTQTNVAASPAIWSPIRTGQFDGFGVFSFTNTFDPAEPQRYFRLQMP